MIENFYYLDIFGMDTEEFATPTLAAQKFDFNSDLEDFASDSSPSFSNNAKSSTISIPKSLNVNFGKSVPEFNSICCKVGSTTDNEDAKRSSNSCTDEIKLSTKDDKVHTGSESSSSFSINKESVVLSKSFSDAGSNRRNNMQDECSASNMIAESVIWLSHRLGPVLTARYLSRNLLRMLTLCYLGRENLIPIIESYDSLDESDLIKVQISGDANATKVLECLSSIVGKI